MTIMWACLLGDSKSQHVYLLTFLFSTLPLDSSSVALVIVSTSSRVLYIVFLFPTHPLVFSTPTTILCLCTYTPLYLVEEVRWGGFIRPLHCPSPHGAVDLPSTSSAYPVDYWLDLIHIYLQLREHPQEGLACTSSLLNSFFSSLDIWMRHSTGSNLEIWGIDYRWMDRVHVDYGRHG